MALWHNLLLSACWAGGSAPAFPLAAFDYWPLMPYLLTAASKTNTGLGAHGATQLRPGASTLPELLRFCTSKPTSGTSPRLETSQLGLQLPQ